MSFSSFIYTIIIYPLTMIIEMAFSLFAQLFSATGLAVIGVSFTVTLLCLPLYIVAEKWQQVERDTQNRMKSGVDRIKSVFKGDEQYMVLSTYYRQNHYHPVMALRSSFGLLIQVPFFIAAYNFLSHLSALNGASFLFIDDMGKPDALFSIGEFSVNILPVAMTLINCMAGMIYTKGLALREKFQIYGMAAIFLVLLYNSPSGLVLYWTMNNIFSLVKNIFYKLKNPLRVLYILLCAIILFADIFIMFIYKGAADFSKRLPVVLFISVFFFLPPILRFVNFLLGKPFFQITQNTRERFLLFAISAVALAFMAGLVLPSEIISSSVQEFANIGSYSNPRAFLADSFIQSAGIFIFWPMCIYFLFGKKVQTLIAVIFSAGLFSAIVNVYIFSGNYGFMTTALKFIGSLKSQSLVFVITNALAVVAVFVIVFLFFNFKKTKIVLTAQLLVCFIFVISTAVNVVRINGDYGDFENILVDGKNKKASGDNIINLSKDNPNVVVFMLDMADRGLLEDIMKERADIRKSFDGFVFYRNTLAFAGYTLMSTPSIFGGYEYTPAETNKRADVTLKAKHNEASLMMARIFTEQADFDAALYDTSWGNYSYYADMSFADDYDQINGVSVFGKYTSEFKKEFAENFSSLPDEFSLQAGIKRNLIWVSFFRSAIVAIRPAVYYKGSWWSVGESNNVDLFVDCFAPLYYLPKHTNLEASKSNFVMMTNDTTHDSTDIRFLELFPMENRRQGTSFEYDVDEVVFQTLGKWFDFLRANDCYDNTRIIIVSDHGLGLGYDTPIFFFKDFGSSDDFREDMTFRSVADVPTLALTGIVQNPINPFTGNSVDDSLKSNGVYITTDEIAMPNQTKSKNIFTIKEETWYHVKDNIFDDANWVQKKPE